MNENKKWATAFLVPSTTRNREWNTIEETYLYTILCRTLDKHTPPVDIVLYVGYDSNDPIYSKDEERLKLNAIFIKFKIVWVEFKPDPGNVVAVWNGLLKRAMGDGFDWFKILGDDIRLPNDPSWLRVFQKAIVANDYIGWSAGYSNNDNIATQFLIHKTHYQIYEFVFPPPIKNYFCDDWMNMIYPEKYKYWRKDYPLLNCGGQPRYDPRNDKKLCEMLVKRYKRDLPEFLNMIDKIKK
jgi:hypothetical protein|tara:strand:- start:1486 stop:2205 length:720 start_codon:yes stop_codon:yes gene_type:complete